MPGFVLLMILTIALAVISCLGNSESAYTSLPMVMLWGATACTAFWYILKRKLYHNAAVFALHCAFIVILLGALITFLTGSTDTLHIRVGETVKIGNITVRLDNFEVIYHPGTMAPADFVSSLTVDGHEATVAMNKVFSHKGYRFFQSAYDPDSRGTILTVNHDQAGTAVSYIGYVLLLVAMLWCMIDKRIRRKCAIIALALMSTTAANAEPQVLPESTAREFGNLFVYYNGRVAPLSTLAADFSKKITGSLSYNGYTPEQFLTGWIFFYDSWKNEPCFKIKDSATRTKLGIEGKYASITDFFSPTGEYLLTDATHSEANEKFGLASTAAAGSLWKVFPVNVEGESLKWYSPADKVSTDMELDKWHFVSHCFNYLAELAAKSNWEGLESAVKKVKLYQEKEVPPGILPSPYRVKAEKLFTSLASSTLPIAGLALCGLILFFYFSIPVSRTVAVAGSLWIAFLIILNWIASASVPMANGYETMQWMALCACLCGVCMPRKYGHAIPLCIFVAAMALLVALFGQNNPQVTQAIPVLRSPLLSIHVLTVMLAYSAFAIMALCGIAYLAGRSNLIQLSRAMLEPAVFLLAAGIFIGAVWANQSWGRYWGWDPKEVWALITMIVYSFALHRGTLIKMRSDRFYAIFTIIAFTTVIMTYFGVNFILGGLHSYA